MLSKLMKIILITDDAYLAKGFATNIFRIKCLSTSESIDYFSDNYPAMYLVIVDQRSSGLEIMKLTTRWRRKDCIILLQSKQFTAHNIIGTNFPYSYKIDLTLPVNQLLMEILSIFRKHKSTPLRNYKLEYLTPKQTEILRMLVSGWSVRKISFVTGLTETSVYGHRNKIVKKYGFTTFSQFFSKLFPKGNTQDNSMKENILS